MTSTYPSPFSPAWYICIVVSYGERFGRRCESIGVVGVQNDYVYTASLVRMYRDIFLSLLGSDMRRNGSIQPSKVQHLKSSPGGPGVALGRRGQDCLDHSFRLATNSGRRKRRDQNSG